MKINNFEVEQGTYVPDMGLEYSETDPYVRMYRPVYDREYRVDENYPFVDDSLKYRILNVFSYIFILYISLGIWLRLNTGLRFKGRENLKKYKDVLKGGYITISNHCLRHDCESVLIGVGAKHTTRIPMFQKNFETKDQFFLRVVGGIPIPPAEEGLSAMKCFNSAFDEFHRRGWSFHIFPEMSKWPWYPALRPFQKGAFTMSYKYGMPIVPCAITYRPRTGIYRLFGKKEEPLITVEIGEPILPQKDAPRKAEVDRMREEALNAMLKMMHIKQNPWKAAPDDER